MPCSTGSVAFLFDFRSIFVLKTAGRSEDELLEVALEAGADDVEHGEDLSTILASPTSFAQVKAGLEQAGLELESSETGYIPQSYVQVGSKEELGAAAGINVPTTAVVILEEGEAKETIGKLVSE